MGKRKKSINEDNELLKKVSKNTISVYPLLPYYYKFVPSLFPFSSHNLSHSQKNGKR
jgi:hypothetical protein